MDSQKEESCNNQDVYECVPACLPVSCMCVCVSLSPSLGMWVGWYKSTQAGSIQCLRARFGIYSQQSTCTSCSVPCWVVRPHSACSE